MGTLSKKKITSVSKAEGFEKREDSKICAHALILSFMKMIASGQNSYGAWACQLAGVIESKISKQAIFYRMTEAWVSTVKALVAVVIGKQAIKQVKRALFSGFKNVWIQDSTCVQLPQALIQKFTGSIVNGKQNSVAKLNVIVHALSGFCPLLKWDSYTVTEQSLSASIMGVAKKGDLVIRDLGYFVLRVFNKMDDEGISFLSRWKYKVTLYDIKTEQEINLLERLQGKSYLDIQVLCGREERVNVRLVAIKLPADRAAERIRKARQDRNKRANHNEEYYALLAYVIFITNVGEEIWNYKQVAAAYRVRWNIEILFKSWKSGLRVEQMIPDAEKHTERVESALYLMLLYITWFQMLVYIPLRWDKEKRLSVIKAAKWMLANILRWIEGEITAGMKKEILYYCSYDTRRRINAIGRLELFFSG